MSLSIEIPKKAQENLKIKVSSANEVFKLKEVQEIKDAVQEHLLFIGLDMRNNIRNVSLLGIGTSNEIIIDSKYIVRTALVTASDKVILVHNHPSNGLTPSNKDIYLTNITNKLLDAYNIRFLDHIIVTENGYLSMGEIKAIDNNYENNKIKLINTIFLQEENNILKKEIKTLTNKLQRYEKIIQDTEEME